MRNLVIIIEAILFLIFIGYTGLGIQVAMRIKDNFPLQCGVFTFFCIVILLALAVAFFTIKKTIKLFDGNTLGVREFIKQKIKQDKFIILLIWLIIGEIALTLFWLLSVSLFVYFVIFLATDSQFLGPEVVTFDPILIVWVPYFAFLCASYYVLYGFLKGLLGKSSFLLPYFIMLAQLFITRFILDRGLISLWGF